MSSREWGAAREICNYRVSNRVLSNYVVARRAGMLQVLHRFHSPGKITILGIFESADTDDSLLFLLLVIFGRIFWKDSFNWNWRTKNFALRTGLDWNFLPREENMIKRRG